MSYSRTRSPAKTALLLGGERQAATEFSFFLALPTMFAATAFDLDKNWHALSLEGVHLIAVGFVTAFASAALVVRWLVAYVARHEFEPFAWYRIVVGLVSLWC
jgi:undecaprenyl-diphosphatase